MQQGAILVLHALTALCRLSMCMARVRPVMASLREVILACCDPSAWQGRTPGSAGPHKRCADCWLRGHGPHSGPAQSGSDSGSQRRCAHQQICRRVARRASLSAATEGVS